MLCSRRRHTHRHQNHYANQPLPDLIPPQVPPVPPEGDVKFFVSREMAPFQDLCPIRPQRTFYSDTQSPDPPPPPRRHPPTSPPQPSKNNRSCTHSKQRHKEVIFESSIPVSFKLVNLGSAIAQPLQKSLTYPEVITKVKWHHIFVRILVRHGRLIYVHKLAPSLVGYFYTP